MHACSCRHSDVLQRTGIQCIQPRPPCPPCGHARLQQVLRRRRTFPAWLEVIIFSLRLIGVSRGDRVARTSWL